MVFSCTCCDLALSEVVACGLSTSDVVDTKCHYLIVWIIDLTR